MKMGPILARADGLGGGHHHRCRTKSTFELNLYLVPERPDTVPVGVGVRWQRHLERRGIVGPYFDLGLGWLGPGPCARAAFPQASAARAPFDCVIVWDGAPELVPNAHTGRFGALCACGAELDDELHAMLAAQGAGAAPVVTGLTCACGRTTPWSELVTELPLVLTGAYLNFCHVDCVELAPELVADLAALAGSPLRVLHERL